MSLQLEWVGDEPDRDRIARTLMLCYSHTGTEMERYREEVKKDTRLRRGDWLLASRDGEDLGIAASFSFQMHMRGASFPCQGVGNVGTIKTARRKGNSKASGIGTTIMRALLDKAREREQVLSALMPFRASFYEHFGYGVAERRVEWTVPLSIMRTTSDSGVRFYREGDRPALVELGKRVAWQGQCDIERDDFTWDWALSPERKSFLLVGQMSDKAPLESFMQLGHETVDGKDRLVVPGPRFGGLLYSTVDALERQLSFVASLRDQYHSVVLTLPVDVPLNLLLRESQLPRRAVNHAHASARPYTRMQVRVLNHRRLLESISWPKFVRGSAVIAVQESEGVTTRFKVDVEDGHATVAPSSATPDLASSDGTWAQIACGDLRASTAWKLGLIVMERPEVLAILDGLAFGPTPFTTAYF